MTAKGPWKRSRVNIILYINDLMPIIECQKADKSRKLLWKHYVSKQILNHISTKSPKVPLRPWAEKWIHLSHKRTLWIEEPESKFRKKGMQEDSYERTKVQKHKRCKMAWEWGTNEYICLPYVTILWGLSWKLLKDRGKMKLIFLASKELSWLWNLGFHFPKLDYHQWLKVHTIAIWEI